MTQGTRNTRRAAALTMTAGAAAVMLAMQGCVATRDYVSEQTQPISSRVAENEARLAQLESQLGGRLNTVELKLNGVEGKLATVDSQTQQAIAALSNLKLERRVVVDLKDGANFGFDSAGLPVRTKKDLNTALAELKNNPALLDGATVVVAGHTDATGDPAYNYELGQRRASTVARYLSQQKELAGVQVIPVSYGETAPLDKNNTAKGRAANRRVEILVYRDEISTSGAAGSKTSSLQR
jgi:outer membrane protein OmpA-like peptidoglycan-associated protein